MNTTRHQITNLSQSMPSGYSVRTHAVPNDQYTQKVARACKLRLQGMKRTAIAQRLGVTAAQVSVYMATARRIPALRDVLPARRNPAITGAQRRADEQAMIDAWLESQAA